MNLKRSTVERYARGSAPFAAIPLPGIGAVVFLRGHLQAAMATGPSRITYNADTKTVTFRTSRSEWKLNDLLGQEKIQQWQLHQQLTAWAAGKRSGARRRKATKALGKAGVYVRRLQEAIAKLTKRRDKISLRRPVSPLILSDYQPEVSDYERQHVRDWTSDKPTRKALAALCGRKFLHSEPKTWTDFYRAVEAVTGRPVSENATHARVHGRKRYRHGLPDHPDREDYLKNLPRYLVRAEKPWDQKPWEPYKKHSWGEQLNSFEQHAKARREYCDALRERMAIDSQIEVFTLEIKSIEESRA